MHNNLKRIAPSHVFNSVLSPGDDAVKSEVERHRQLLHESRLSQGLSF